MSNTEGLVRFALNLYSLGPQNAGLSLFVGGGPVETKTPVADGPAAELAAEHGLQRDPEERPALELCVFVDHDGAKYSARIEKVTGVGFLETIPDETINVGSFEAEAVEEIEPELIKCLDEVSGESELRLMKVFYRKDEFTKVTFDRDREATENPSKLKRWQGFADQELREYVYSTFRQALEWGPENGNPESVSVWLYPATDGNVSGAIYIKVVKVDDGFGISLEDRHCSPWAKKVGSVETVYDIPGFVAKYLSKTHAFKWTGARSYFAYSETQS